MSDFLDGVLYELSRIPARMWYFIRTGHLHPEVDPLGARRRTVYAELGEVEQ